MIQPLTSCSKKAYIYIITFSYFLLDSQPINAWTYKSNLQAFVFCFSHRLNWTGKNPREEPKGIVFLSKLRLLFQHCHLCFSSNPALSVTQTGTMMTIQSSCSRCSDTFLWQSQPNLLGKFPAGNLLLSFAILCAGASVNKVLLVFRHMVMLIYSEPTYYYHQRYLLIPAIVSFWRSYQAKIISSLKGKEVTLQVMADMTAWANQQSMVHTPFFAVQWASLFTSSLYRFVNVTNKQYWNATII